MILNLADPVTGRDCVISDPHKVLRYGVCLVADVRIRIADKP